MNPRSSGKSITSRLNRLRSAKRLLQAASLWSALEVAAVLAAPGSSDLFTASIQFEKQAPIRVRVSESSNAYHILYRGVSSIQVTRPTAVSLVSGELADLAPPVSAAFYRVKRVPIALPDDSDSDGLDDVFEARRPRYLNPLDASDRLRPQDGTFSIRDRDEFNAFSARGDTPGALAAPQLKFIVAGVDTEFPLVYFMQSGNHPLHAPFAFDVLHWRQTLAEFNEETYFTDTRRKNLAGSLVAYGTRQPGSSTNQLLAMEFWPADPVRFDFVKKAVSAISNQMPWATGQLFYHPTGVTQEELAKRESAKYAAARIPLIFSDELFASLEYSPIYAGTSFGLLRQVSAGVAPTVRDIVIVPEPPVALGHVAGIVTATAPSPLSHFSLLTRQNRTPSAYLKGALDDPRLKALLGKLVRFEVTGDGLSVREATSAELQQWEDSVRPQEPRFPPRDLTERRIRKLADLGSADSGTVGSKAANVAELQKFLPLGMVPDGFAIPYALYDEFMTFNGFYDVVRELIAKPGFASDLAYRAQALSAFQDRMIHRSTLPAALAASLDEVQKAFPAGTRIRCRSSSNNEDLPGFNGAGLYDSFTHRPNEGALANTVKQVWASLWNLRAFDEREFQRIDHFQSAMGVLLHPSFPDESANGVAVTRNVFDPAWPGFYINAQVGEDLVTSPEPGSIPDQLLVSAIGPEGENEVQYIRTSNRTPPGEHVLNDEQVQELINALAAIGVHFRPIYQQEGNPAFAMEIEFKITSSGRLSIKQARPWVE